MIIYNMFVDKHHGPSYNKHETVPFSAPDGSNSKLTYRGIIMKLGSISFNLVRYFKDVFKIKMV